MEILEGNPEEIFEMEEKLGEGWVQFRRFFVCICLSFTLLHSVSLYAFCDFVPNRAFGIVCRCKNRRDGKTYAVKVIEMEGENDDAVRKEVDILKRLDSDTVVRYGGCYKKGSTLLVRILTHLLILLFRNLFLLFSVSIY